MRGRILFAAFTVAFIALPFIYVTPAQAETTVRTGEAVSVESDQEVTGNFYAFGNTVSIAGAILGDLHALGGAVTVNGDVDEDIFLVGGTVNLNASTTGDVRIIANQATISEPVGGNLTFLGNQLEIQGNAAVDGDVLVFGSQVTINGPVTGSVFGRAQNVRLNGAVGDEVSLRVDELTLGSNAAIDGDVVYTSNTELVRAQSASVSGEIIQETPQLNGEGSNSSLTSTLIPLFVSLFATLSIYLLFGRRLTALVNRTISSFGLSSLIGFAAIILAPIVVTVLLVSLLGLFVGLIGFFLFLLGFVVTLSVMNAVAGGLLSRLATGSVTVNAPWIMLGAIALHALLLIPVIGGLVFLVLLLGTLGGMVYQSYKRLR